MVEELLEDLVQMQELLPMLEHKIKEELGLKSTDLI
jgi:hypothetical protein